jgi:hypothetical protein
LELDLNKIIILASTPLHLLGSITISFLDRDSKYYLIYIDQKDKTYYSSLKEWRESPFERVYITLTQKSSLLDKIKSKRESIKKIFSIIESINPDKIIVGNDRKTEISALVVRFRDRVDIEYLDDGIHSYILEKSSIFKYTILDNIIRSLIYGYKIETPKYIGCSSYIKKAYLFKPNLANSCIKNKPIAKLDIEVLKSKEVRLFVELILKRLNIDIKTLLKDIDTTLFLPHQKELNSSILNKLIDKFDKSNIAIKTHPRDNITSKSFKNAKILPKSIPTEFLILFIPQNIKIFGFATTSLLSAKWLNSSLDISSIEFENGNREIEKLMRESGIEAIYLD